MTDDLPLGHPAREPDAAAQARVLARVDATVRRRRARRRALVTLPVIAVVVLVAGIAVGARQDDSGEDRQAITAGPGERGELAFEPDVEWDSAVLSTDGKTLTVTAGRVLHDPRGCQLEVISDVVETEDSVVVALKDSIPAGSSFQGLCARPLTPAIVKVPLAEPLGDRAVFDGLRDEPRTVFRQSDLVQLLYLPAGFATDVDEINFGDPANVQQTYNADGADWYFAVNQQERPFSEPTDGTSEPITVNGVEGERITGQMNNTMESIRFELDGTFVTVWGEMQGPPTFTHADELLKIAEGIRLPEPGAERPATSTSSVPAETTPEAGAPPEDDAPGQATPAPRDCQGPPGSATDLEGQPDWSSDGYHAWTDRSGCLLRVDVLTDGPGPAHCNQEDADLLTMSDQLGESYRTPAYTAVFYVRDPLGVFDLPEVTAGFDPDATLPASAVDTGYHRDGIELHVDPADPSAIWLAYPDGHVERWPLADLPPCA